MANCIMIMGPSGSGKSSSMRNLDPKTTFVLSVLDKPLPFKAYKKSYQPIRSWDDIEGNYYASDDWIRILKCIDMIQEKRTDIKILVIDDVQYILASEFMARSHEKTYEKFSEMASHYWQIIRRAQKCRDDLTVFF
ncbi:MAG: AAA family ATPase, partial [Shewanella sp.]